MGRTVRLSSINTILLLNVLELVLSQVRDVQNYFTSIMRSVSVLDLFILTQTLSHFTTSTVNVTM